MAEARIPTRATVAIMARELLLISRLDIYTFIELVLEVSASTIPAITIKPPRTSNVVIDS